MLTSAVFLLSIIIVIEINCKNFLGETEMHLKILGLNYKTAPIEIREKFSVSKDSIRRGLENLDEYEYEGLNEAVILSTCNRTEIYAVTSNDCEGSVKNFFTDLIGGNVENFLYEYEGENCARHLFEVAASLDSLILGEGQILSQVKDAYTTAKNIGATNTILNTLFHRAIAVGKNVRTETKIAYNSVSVSSAAVELAAEKLGGLQDNIRRGQNGATYRATFKGARRQKNSRCKSSH